MLPLACSPLATNFHHGLAPQPPVAGDPIHLGPLPPPQPACRAGFPHIATVPVLFQYDPTDFGTVCRAAGAMHKGNRKISRRIPKIRDKSSFSGLPQFSGDCCI
jgi:hypothetical protein